MKTIKITWRQEENKIYFKFKDMEIYFIMPEDYKLEKTHPDLLKLAEYLMLSPWYDVLGDYKFSRKQGKNVGLNFSTGVDSTAAMLVLPEETKLVYCERDGIDQKIFKQDNAIRMIENMDREVIRVKTNFERIRTHFNKMVGYSTALGMGVPLILLADYLDLGVISYGKVFDDQFFPKGVYRGYTSDYILRQDLLLSAGLFGLYPLVGCSEVITTRLVDESIYKEICFSCIRGDAGKQCGNCFKCYRKDLLRGKKATLNWEAEYSINKNPPKMAPSLTYAIHKSKTKVPQLKYLEKVDVSMLERAFSPAYDIYGEDIKWEILNMIQKKGVLPMSEEEEYKVKQLNFLRPEEPESKGLPLP